MPLDITNFLFVVVVVVFLLFLQSLGNLVCLSCTSFFLLFSNCMFELSHDTANSYRRCCLYFAVIPKANSVFTFELGGFEFTIHGNHFRYRSCERSARKFKRKPTTDL